MNYPHWAKLNKEGMQIFGEVFPDGYVPVVSFVPRFLNIPTGKQEAYLVKHEELDEKTREKWLELLAKRFEASVDLVRQQMETMRIPLRKDLTSSSGSSAMYSIV